MDIDKAKALEVVLCEGVTSGAVLLKLLTSDLVAVKVPRYDLLKHKELFDGAATVGVYFLFSDDATPPHHTVYVGESEAIYTRLKQHLGDDSSWHTVVAFCSNTINKAVIRFVENALLKEIKKNGHTVNTKASFSNVPLSEAQMLAAQQFIKNIRELLDLFGFTPLSKVWDVPSSNNQYEYSGAHGYPSSKGFTVLKGSDCSMTMTDGSTPSYKILNEKLIDAGVIKNREFVQNYEFPSPSAAASIVKGYTTNGRDAWKLPDGKTLKQVQLEQSKTN